MSSSVQKYDVKTLFLLLGILALIILFWNFILLYPLKLFTVLLHEISHGLAAILTGGRFLRLEISPEMGGVATTAGGWRILVVSAGYLGSMLWGGLVVLLASRLKNDKLISYVIGVILLLLTALFIRGWFGMIFGILFGGGMIALGKFAPAAVNDFVLKVIGLTSVLYAVIDIKDDLISRTVEHSDAWEMSRLLLLPAVFWGILWGVLAVVAAFFVLRASVRQTGSELSK